MSTASAPTALGTSTYAPPAASAPTAAQYLAWTLTGTPFPEPFRAPIPTLPAFATVQDGIEYMVRGRAFRSE